MTETLGAALPVDDVFTAARVVTAFVLVASAVAATEALLPIIAAEGISMVAGVVMVVAVTLADFDAVNSPVAASPPPVAVRVGAT